jgi:hypothetical protein
MRYMKASFGNKCIIPSSTNTKNKSTNIGNYECVPPLHDYCEIDNEVINYWTKPLLPALHSSISNQFYSSREENDGDSFMHRIDFALGGNHGQQKFRMVMKIICRRDDMPIIDQWQIKIGHIDCKKDTYEVLKRTIVPKLNEDLVLLGEGQK